MGSPNLRREDFLHHSHYCEENVWQLCKKLGADGHRLGDVFVVFVSNHNKTIPLWCQAAADANVDGLVIWDYHVFVVYCTEGACCVLDLDTTLPFPCPFVQYLDSAIKDDAGFRDRYRRYFRVCGASDYLDNFSSNRLHMKKGDGSWLMPPPPWPPIHTDNCDNNLAHFWTMDHSDKTPVDSFSSVFDYDQFRSKFMSRS